MAHGERYHRSLRLRAALPAGIVQPVGSLENLLRLAHNVVRYLAQGAPEIRVAVL